MTHAGNIVGFGFGMDANRSAFQLIYIFTAIGFLPLAGLPILRLLGGDQFRKFCVVAMAILVITVCITCFCHKEKERQDPFKLRKSVFHYCNFACLTWLTVHFTMCWKIFTPPLSSCRSPFDEFASFRSSLSWAGAWIMQFTASSRLILLHIRFPFLFYAFVCRHFN
jgi:hypothetical protein